MNKCFIVYIYCTTFKLALEILKKFSQYLNIVFASQLFCKCKFTAFTNGLHNNLDEIIIENLILQHFVIVESAMFPLIQINFNFWFLAIVVFVIWYWCFHSIFCILNCLKYFTYYFTKNGQSVEFSI